MNECVKTGFTFLEVETGLKRVGDLFFVSGMFQIRGIPFRHLSDDVLVDAIAANTVLCYRRDGTYLDSNIGVKLIAPSQDFKNFLAEWYPEIFDIVVPLKGRANGQVARTFGSGEDTDSGVESVVGRHNEEVQESESLLRWLKQVVEHDRSNAAEQGDRGSEPGRETSNDDGVRHT